MKNEKEKYARRLEINPNFYLEKYRKNMHTIRQHDRISYLNNRNNKIEKVTAWKNEHLEKVNAVKKLNKLFRDGNIKTNDEFNCAICSNDYNFKLVKHIENTDIPFSFIVLCKSCHTNMCLTGNIEDNLANHRIDIDLNKRKDN